MAVSTVPDPMTRRQDAGNLMDQFIAAVTEMRTAQKLFYATFGQDKQQEHTQALRDSKRLESEVDGMIRLMKPPAETGLFSQEQQP